MIDAKDRTHAYDTPSAKRKTTSSPDSARLDALVMTATRVLPKRAVQTDEYKRMQAMEQEKEEAAAKSAFAPRRYGPRPRAPKELAKAAARVADASRSRDIPRGSVTARKTAPSVRGVGQYSDANMTSRQPQHMSSIGGVLFPYETGPMVGPLANLGRLPRDETMRKRSQPAQQRRRHTTSVREKSDDRALIQRNTPPLFTRTNWSLLETPPVPSTALVPVHQPHEMQRRAGDRNGSPEEEFSRIARQLVESLDPAFDTHTIYLNVCRLLNQLTSSRTNVTKELIIHSNLNNIVGALLSSDDVRIRLAADSLLKVPIWREAICGSATPRHLKHPYVIPPPFHVPGMPLPEQQNREMTYFMNRLPVPHAQPLTELPTKNSQDSPTDTSTPPQPQAQFATDFPFNTEFAPTSQDSLDASALLLSSQGDGKLLNS